MTEYELREMQREARASARMLSLVLIAGAAFYGTGMALALWWWLA